MTKACLAVHLNSNDDATFFNIVGFNGNAVFMQKFLSKGDFVVVDGKVSQNKVTKNGEEIIHWNVVVDYIFSKPKYGPFAGQLKKEEKEELKSLDESNLKDLDSVFCSEDSGNN